MNNLEKKVDGVVILDHQLIVRRVAVTHVKNPYKNKSYSLCTRCEARIYYRY